MPRFLALSFRLLVTLAMVATAIVVGLALWDYYMEAPWTRDGRVRADVVPVAPDVSGLVTEVLVEDNQVVRRGDVLFRIDPDRFALALRQAEAVVEGKRASAEQAAAEARGGAGRRCVPRSGGPCSSAPGRSDSPHSGYRRCGIRVQKHSPRPLCTTARRQALLSAKGRRGGTLATIPLVICVQGGSKRFNGF